ncbi:acyltransferase family protein [Brevundimonas vesicularis]|uniref:acyltransferase family protein n=1 Tax=Brevundimonas vesicularis TaxID=41276 RepID=UPI0038D4C653
MSQATLPPPRRHDLDAIRVGAFGLLILYHLGMVYVPWRFHVNSQNAQVWLEPVMQFTNPWRMTLLFLISGAATRLLYDRYRAQGPGAGERLAGSRMLRLGLPLLFGMLVVVAPHTYFQVVELARENGLTTAVNLDQATANFWLRYLSASGDWCQPEGCILTPTWNHLWFVAYILVYGLITAIVMGLAHSRLFSWVRGLERILSGPGLFLWPITFLALIRILIFPRFPVTHDLIQDLYTHALSLSAFGLGFLLVDAPKLTERLKHHRHVFLLMALTSYAAFALYMGLGRDGPDPGVLLRNLMRAVYAVDQWSFIAAILGYSAHHITAPSRLMAYLGGGVFTFYILHQTLIITSFALLEPLSLPLAVEASLILLITLIGCLLGYEVARRLGPLGLLLGVSPAKLCLSRPRQAAVTETSPNHARPRS